VLTSTGWNLTLAAEILGSTRQTLRRKLDQYGIDKPVPD
jgi:DNA-binding protein Fis